MTQWECRLRWHLNTSWANCCCAAAISKGAWSTWLVHCWFEQERPHPAFPEVPFSLIHHKLCFMMQFMLLPSTQCMFLEVQNFKKLSYTLWNYRKARDLKYPLLFSCPILDHFTENDMEKEKQEVWIYIPPFTQSLNTAYSLLVWPDNIVTNWYCGRVVEQSVCFSSIKIMKRL